MLIAGVDEVGRGALAGPVVAGAVILKDFPIQGIMDSKKLTASKRERLAKDIRREALAYAIGQASAKEIDTYNILNATLLAMKRAVQNLAIIPDQVLIDGNCSPILPYPTQTIIRGDQLSPVISAASIFAKVCRDRLMQDLHQHYPQYGFAQHKGYGTAQHQAALWQYGCTPLHRFSFAPVMKVRQAK